MCGIVGLAGKLKYPDEKLMKTLLINDYVRGPDATGFASVTDQNEFRVAKIPSHPFDLLDMTCFKTALSAYSSKAFIGHNRAATRGQKNKANAHPFEHGDIVGVHNGTLEFPEWTALEKALGMRFGTDSEAIIAGISKLGVKETISMISGAWSLVWVNRADNTLNFLRNTERPMYLAFSKDYDKLLFTSAWEILSASIMMTPDHDAHTDLAHEDTKTMKGVTYRPTDPDVHYAFNLEELAHGGKHKPKPVARKIVGKAREVRKEYHSPFTTLGEDTGQSNILNLPPPINQTKNGQKNSTGADKVHESVTNLFSNQPFAQWIAKEKFDEMNRHGCSWCGSNDYEWEDAGWIVIENGDFLICPNCTAERSGNRVYTAKEPYLS